MSGNVITKCPATDCKTLRRLHKRQRKLVAELRTANTSGNNERLRKAVRTCLDSEAFRVCAALSANRALPLDRRKPLPPLIDLAGSITFGTPVPEPVTVTAIPKASGGYRTICNPGITNRTIHHALRSIIAPGFKPQPWQYEFRTGGVATAVTEIKQAILAGNIWAARLDIREFFSSFTGPGLKKLLPHIPMAVIENNILAAKLDLKLPKGPCTDDIESSEVVHTVQGVGTSHADTLSLLKKARRGICQGAAHSPLIAALAVSRLGPLPGTVVFNWCDDFLVLAASQEAVVADAKAVASALTELPGGDFSLIGKGEPPHACTAEEGFQFLAHEIDMHKGSVRVEAAFPDTFYGPLSDFDALYVTALSKGDKAGAFKAVGRTWVFGCSWLAAFKVCDDAPEYLKHLELAIDERLPSTGRTWDDVTAFNDPGAKFKLQKYS